MLAVSTIRPWGKDPEWDRNQSAAYETWVQYFDRVIYLQKTGWPLIHELVECLMQCGDYGCLLNSDIVLRPSFVAVQQILWEKDIEAATARRRPYLPPYAAEKTETRPFDDYGLDIFIAKIGAWERVLREIPRTMYVGHPAWDCWLCGYFNATCPPGKFVDFTNHDCVWHPVHGGRVFAMESKVPEDNYRKRAGIPTYNL